MDTLGALALATEPPHDSLMKRPPVGRSESLITLAMWRNIIGQSIYQLFILLVLNFSGKQILGLSGTDATAVLNTFIFNTFVFCQVKKQKLLLYSNNLLNFSYQTDAPILMKVFNEINSRDIEKINIFQGIFGNWVFTGIIVSTVVFQVIIVEFLGTFTSTVPLDGQLWALSALLGALSMPIAVILKCIPVKRKADDARNDYVRLPNGPELA